MAHYAFLDDDNNVIDIIVGIDETELIEGLSPEEWYGNFRNQKCLRTSYNGNIRKNYAEIGGYYDEDNDAFIPLKPYPSWILNNQSFRWEPPVLYPETSGEDLDQYFWKEETLSWERL